jgi:hydrogenase maturation protease
MPSILIGLGNPSLGDDGIGWRILDALEGRLDPQVRAHWDFERLSLGGLSLMEHLIGYDRAILIDSIAEPGSLPGKVRRLTLTCLPGTHANAAHDASFKDAMLLGEKLGVELPQEIIIFAIQIERKLEFSSQLSPEVALSIEPAVETILNELQENV